MSADVCPVCGCVEITAYENIQGETKKSLDCGGDGSLGCEHAERLAISRAAEIERLKAEKAGLLALCKRLSALPGDYNTIHDAEFVFRDLNASISKANNQEKP